MLTVYRAELPRTLTLVVARSLAVPAASFVVREFHSDSQITITANLDRDPFEGTMTTVCGEMPARVRNREPDRSRARRGVNGS
jgi:hypothetical protein